MAEVVKLNEVKIKSPLQKRVQKHEELGPLIL